MSFVRAFAPSSLRVVLIAALAAAAVPAFADAVAWRTNVDSARIEAADTGKLMLLHFYTSSCGPCKVLDRDVFSQPQVDAALQKNFIPVKVDADTSPALAGAYRITRVPTDVLLSPQGAPLASLSCPKDPAAYLQQLDNFATHYAQTTGRQGGTNAQPPVNAAYAGLSVQPQTSQSAASGTTPAAMNNPYGSTRPNYMAQATTPTPGQSQPVYPNQLAAQAAPQTFQNPYAAAAQPAAAQAAPAGGDNRYAAAGTVAPYAGNGAAPQSTAAPAAPAAGQYAQQTAPTTPAAQPAVASQGTVQQVAAQAPVQLPPGAAPLGMEGFCPVTLRTAGKWVRGNAAIGMEHRGRTYLFASETERQQFNADPDRYSPVFSGQDPVLMLERSESVAGTRTYGCVHQDRVYLFSSQATLAKFSERPEQYAASVRQAMSRIDGAPDGTIRR
ncbi:MAG: thioredoxin family protein [Planctomycetales bacterium]|nr:thioredoxin family protein [Planctomycetales bacterium]